MIFKTAAEMLSQGTDEQKARASELRTASEDGARAQFSKDVAVGGETSTSSIDSVVDAHDYLHSEGNPSPFQNWEDLARTAIGSRIGSENDPVNINDLDFNGALVKIEGTKGDLRELWAKTLRHAVGTLVRADFFENETVEVVGNGDMYTIGDRALLVVGEATINVGSTQLTVTDGSIFSGQVTVDESTGVVFKDAQALPIKATLGGGFIEIATESGIASVEENWTAPLTTTTGKSLEVTTVGIPNGEIIRLLYGEQEITTAEVSGGKASLNIPDQAPFNSFEGTLSLVVRGPNTGDFITEIEVETIIIDVSVDGPTVINALEHYNQIIEVTHDYEGMVLSVGVLLGTIQLESVVGQSLQFKFPSAPDIASLPAGEIELAIGFNRGDDTEPIVVRKQVEIKHPVITIQESWSEEHLNSQVVSPTITVGLDGLVNSPLNFPVLLNGSVEGSIGDPIDIADLTKDQDNDQFQIEVCVGTVQVGTELEFVYSSSETFSVHTSVPDDKIEFVSRPRTTPVSAISTDLILVTGNIVVPATELIVTYSLYDITSTDPSFELTRRRISELNDGRHTVLITVEDAYGNFFETSTEFIVQHPTISVAAQWVNTLINLNLVSEGKVLVTTDEAGADAEVEITLEDRTINGFLGQDIQLPSDLLVDKEGNQVTATISVGKDDQGYFYNESSDFNIDTIPPNLTVTGPMGPYDGFKDINFVVTTSDNSSIIVCSLNDSTELTVNTEKTDHHSFTLTRAQLATLQDGDHQILVIAADDAGNQTELVRRFTVEHPVVALHPSWTGTLGLADLPAAFLTVSGVPVGEMVSVSFGGGLTKTAMVEGLTGGKSVEVGDRTFTTDPKSRFCPRMERRSPSRPRPPIRESTRAWPTLEIFRSKTSLARLSMLRLRFLRRMSIPSTKVLPWTRSSSHRRHSDCLDRLCDHRTQLQRVRRRDFGRRFHLRHIPHAGTRSIRDLQPRRRIGLCPTRTGSLSLPHQCHRRSREHR